MTAMIDVRTLYFQEFFCTEPSGGAGPYYGTQIQYKSCMIAKIRADLETLAETFVTSFRLHHLPSPAQDIRHYDKAKPPFPFPGGHRFGLA